MVNDSEYIRKAEATRVRVLSEALHPTIYRSNHCCQIRWRAMKNSTLKDKVIRDIVFFVVCGVRPVVVHGGGPKLTAG